MSGDRRDYLREIWRRWDLWLKRGKDAKKQFNKDAKKVELAFSSDHDALLKDGGLDKWIKGIGSSKGALLATVNLPFQVRLFMGPGLYHRNPSRKVTPRSTDSILDYFSHVLEAYLNYTPNETGLAKESRLVIDDALLLGRGCMRVGLDDKTGLVTSWHWPIKDVLIDADAQTADDAQWIAMRERLTLRQIEKRWKGAGKKIRNRMRNKGQSDMPVQVKSQLPLDDEDRDRDPGTNVKIEVWTIYSVMGLGNDGMDVPEEFRDHEDSQEHIQIVIAPHALDEPLNDVLDKQKNGWEVPLYVDNAWPCVFLDLAPGGKLWPLSRYAAALPNARAVDLLTTLELHLAKNHARDLYFVNAELPDDIKDRIAFGDLSEIMEMKGPGGLKISEIITKFDTGQISPEIAKARDFHLNAFGETTGLLPLLKGQFDVQARSATEADLRDKNARSPLTDMSEQVETAHTESARLEALTIRLLLSAEQVEDIVGNMTGLKVVWLAEFTLNGEVIPQRDDSKDAISMEKVLPGADGFFSSREEAESAAVGAAVAKLGVESDLTPEVMQSIAQTPDPMKTLFDALVKQAASDGKVFPDGAPKIRKVTVQDLWDATADLGPERLAREVSYRIEAGSTKRPDHNRAIALSEQTMQIVAPIAQQIAFMTGDFSYMDRLLKARDEALDIPQDQQFAFGPVQLPPPEPPAGAKEGAK